MKKCIKVIIIGMILSILIVSYSFADNGFCNINISPEKTQVKQGDIITINVSLSNITKEAGIDYITSFIEYSTDVFDIQYDTSDIANSKIKEIKESGEIQEEVKMIYVGDNDTTIGNSNKWNMAMLINNNWENNGLVAYTNNAQKSDQIIAKIKLKVKDNAKAGEYNVKLKDVVIYDVDGNEDKKGDSNISLTVINSISETTNIQQTNTQQVNNTSINKTEDKASTKVPYTGVEDYILVFALVLVNVIIAYIIYRKYKNIK